MVAVRPTTWTAASAGHSITAVPSSPVVMVPRRTFSPMHPVFDGHSFDRLIGLRRDGAEGQPAGFFLVGFLRGAFGSAGLDSQGRLKASEAEASDE